MTELEKAKEKVTQEYMSGTSILISNGVTFGFNEALKPEHMKLTEEVKGLIEALKVFEAALGYYETKLSGSWQYCDELAKEALKPFEKETENE